MFPITSKLLATDISNTSNLLISTLFNDVSLYFTIKLLFTIKLVLKSFNVLVKLFTLLDKSLRFILTLFNNSFNFSKDLLVAKVFSTGEHPIPITILVKFE